MIGRLDEKGNVVPTSGRRGRLPKKSNDSLEDSQTNFLRNEIEELKRKNSLLEAQISDLRKEKDIIISGIQKLLNQVT